MAETILHSGCFNDYNGNIIDVTFYKKSQTDAVINQDDLQFSGIEPVLINYNGSADDIYAPVRGSSCDINIVSEKILDDLYTAQKDEVCVRIKRKERIVQQVLKWDRQGSSQSQSISPEPTSDNYYEIHSKTLFFKDITGTFFFTGEIKKDAYQNVYPVVLAYNRDTNTWEESGAYGLTYTDQVFDNQDFLYKISEESGDKYVYEWDGMNWTDRTLYRRWMDDEQSYTVPYSAADIVNFTGGGTELLHGNERYNWSTGDKNWHQTDSYSSSDGMSYMSLNGSTFRRVLNKNGELVDTCVVTGLDNDNYSNWVVEMHPSETEFTPIIPIDTDLVRDPDYLFTDDDGHLYGLDPSGDIYFWSWDIEGWVKWITIDGDGEFRDDTFALDYVIPRDYNHSKRVVITYLNDDQERRAFTLTNIQAPKVHYEEEWTGDYTETVLWEGYKVPNTYTQDVTQNLDNIQMTAIDPVSILKYVKIDNLMTKPNIYTFGDLLGMALSYVMLSSQVLTVERAVTYGSSNFNGTNGLLNLKIQVSNFWDEGGEPATAYEMIEEMLRPFCLTLVYCDNTFQIYSTNKTSGVRVFDIYNISDQGTLTWVRPEAEASVVYEYGDDWISNNVQNATIEIGSTYDKVKGTASTSVPTLSTMAFDLVDYNDRDKYDAGGVNIQKNKTKGYWQQRRGYPPVWFTSDQWYYIWNGVYCNPDYHLQSNSGITPIPWYLNVNKAYTYLTGNAGNPNDYGSVLNFYGGINNPTGTGKQQISEKSVDVKKRITGYAVDNGRPLEFLEDSQCKWSYSGSVEGDPTISKDVSDSSVYGTSRVMQDSNMIIYRQKYENMALDANNDQIIDLSLTQSYSRTGLDSQIDIIPGDRTENEQYAEYDDQKYLQSADLYYFPNMWNSGNVKVNAMYFNRYASSSTPSNGKCTQIWDRRRIMMYVKMSNGDLYQFNGKDWVYTASTGLVPDPQPKNSDSFFLLKLMNGEKLYHTDYKYNVIETSDGEHYCLDDENYVFELDSNNGVITPDDPGSAHTTMTVYVYKDPANDWVQWINNCSAGQLSIKLPTVDDVNATVYCDVYNSTMLGMTGSNDNSPRNHIESVWIKDPDTKEPVSKIVTPILPYNVSYVKGEHLDLDIQITVPQSNLGQMFSQSDIQYTIIDKKRNYLEEFMGPTFRINTYNSLVSSSFSYLIFDNAIADPGEFVILDNSGRPECYVVQAYMNWLSTIRKTYSKTILPTSKNKTFSNVRRFITSPEVGTNKLMILSDTVDVKTNRHSITAIECQNLDVTTVEFFAVIEVPRKARADRYNLPTAYKM